MFRLIAIIITIAVFIVSICISAYVGYLMRKKIAEETIGSAEKQADKILIDAKKSAESKKKEILFEAKEESLKIKNEVDKEIKERKAEVQKLENRILQREESLDKRIVSIEKKEENYQQRLEIAERKKAEIEEVLDKQHKELERIAGLTSQQAREFLIETVKNDVRHETAVMIKEMETAAKQDAEKKAKEIIASAIQRCAVDHVTETTVSVVQLPNDEMKGRIIGREGRNIRTLESLTGIELIIDDTPEAVILSGFDPMKREIAKIALEKLILDGRVHPARIEETVEKAKKEVDAMIKEYGDSAAFETGVHGLAPELIKLLGKMKFRTSYGQNVLRHSIEVSILAGLMAEELGVDVNLAKRAGLLHDIGKSVDYEVEGTHIEIGVALCKKYHENEIVINAVEAHHNDVEPKSIIAVLVQAADAVSAARPGARRETLENYVKRLQNLESIADSFRGVEKSFAIQAGRELRVMIIPEEVDDDGIIILARDIANKVKSELEYPGKIKVNLIRETRSVAYAD